MFQPMNIAAWKGISVQERTCRSDERRYHMFHKWSRSVYIQQRVVTCLRKYDTQIDLSHCTQRKTSN